MFSWTCNTDTLKASLSFKEWIDLEILITVQVLCAAVGMTEVWETGKQRMIQRQRNRCYNGFHGCSHTHCKWRSWRSSLTPESILFTRHASPQIQKPTKGVRLRIVRERWLRKFKKKTIGCGTEVGWLRELPRHLAWGLAIWEKY